MPCKMVAHSSQVKQAGLAIPTVQSMSGQIAQYQIFPSGALLVFLVWVVLLMLSPATQQIHLSLSQNQRHKVCGHPQGQSTMTSKHAMLTLQLVEV